MSANTEHKGSFSQSIAVTDGGPRLTNRTEDRRFHFHSSTLPSARPCLCRCLSLSYFIGPNYNWKQTLTDVSVLVAFETAVKARDLDVKIEKGALSVRLKNAP